MVKGVQFELAILEMIASTETLKNGKEKGPVLRQILIWRREGDSNPRDGIRRQHDFQSCTFNRSDTSPRLFPDLSVSALLICISG